MNIRILSTGTAKLPIAHRDVPTFRQIANNNLEINILLHLVRHTLQVTWTATYNFDLHSIFSLVWPPESLESGILLMNGNCAGSCHNLRGAFSR
jgi:hypothetical protein